nr:MAG TPA: hypothetical protein [Caudoviricetes sp.]
MTLGREQIVQNEESGSLDARKLLTKERKALIRRLREVCRSKFLNTSSKIFTLRYFSLSSGIDFFEY